MNITNEETFESNIEESLISSGGYIKGSSVNYQTEVGLDTNLLFQFIQTSQPEAWSKLEEVHGDETAEKFLQRLVKELDLKGMLRVLREGIDDHGVHLDLAYFKPESSLNPETIEKYDQNILSVTRQVHFSMKNPDKSVDVVLFVNGLQEAVYVYERSQ
jgi:type I restriction enzyme R subunit